MSTYSPTALRNALQFVDSLPPAERCAIMDAAKAGDRALVSRLVFESLRHCLIQATRDALSKKRKERVGVEVPVSRKKPILSIREDALPMAV